MTGSHAAEHKASGPQCQSMTVVIPALNAASTIGSQLRALSCQRDAPAFEVIVVDNGSTDDTHTVASSFSSDGFPVQVIWEPKRGINIARNRGISRARDGIVLLCDADDVVSEFWVKSLSESVSDTSWASGPAFSFEDGADESSLDRSFLAQTPLRTHLDSLGGNCAFTTFMWKNIGGFDERLSGSCDETEFFHRAHNRGFEANLVESAWIYYRRRSNSGKGIRDSFRRGLHHAKVARCDGGSFLFVGSPRTYALRRLIRVVLSTAKHVWVSSKHRKLLEDFSYWTARLIAPPTFG